MKINYSNRITPENITELKNNEIFCYGANTGGKHGAGAAKQARKWGAVYGEFKFFGNTYGIATKDDNFNTLPLEEIKFFIDEFIDFARCNPELKFLTTMVGCGLAGLLPKEIAPLFKKAVNIENIHLPKEFWDILVDNNEEKF